MPLVVPAAIVAVCLVVSWRAWRRRAPHAYGHWGGAIALAGAFFSAHVLLLDWPEFPPERSAEWLAWLAVPLCVVGVLQRWWGAWWYTMLPVQILVSVGVCYALLQSKVENSWNDTEAYIWIGALTVALAASWFSLETLAAIRNGASLALSVCAWCGASAVAFTFAGSAAIGQLAAAFAAAWGMAVLLAWWAPGLSVRGGAMAAFVPLFSGLILRSYFFSELTVWSAILLTAAPFALWYGELRRFRFTKPWKSVLVRLGLIVVPSLVAVGIEWWTKMRGEEAF